MAQWYYALGEEVVGPLETDELRFLLRECRLGPSPLVRPSEGAWQTPDAFAELAAPAPRERSHRGGVNLTVPVRPGTQRLPAAASAPTAVEPAPLPPPRSTKDQKSEKSTRRWVALCLLLLILLLLCLALLFWLWRQTPAGGGGGGAGEQGGGAEGGGDGGSGAGGAGSEEDASGGGSKGEKGGGEKGGGENGGGEKGGGEKGGGEKGGGSSEANGGAPDGAPDASEKQTEPPKSPRKGTTDKGIEVENVNVQERKEAEKSSAKVLVRLGWLGTADLDLYIRCPSGESLFFGNTVSDCGGLFIKQDKTSDGEEWFEAAAWINQADRGSYEVRVEFAKDASGPAEQAYQLKHTVAGQEQISNGVVKNGQRSAPLRFTVR